MNENNTIKMALAIINGLEDISPVELSIGWTDKNGYCHKGLVIKSCPPAVVEKLIHNGFILSMIDGGLHVTRFDGGC